MKIAHISDNHSALTPIYGNPDAIICTGDFLPNDWKNMNFERSGLHLTEPEFQTNWLIENKERLINWIGYKKFIFCQGNHEFINPVPILQDFGLDAINITNELYTIDNLNIVGFPYVPYYGGSFNNELTAPEMADKIERLGFFVEDNKIDILCCHCPPNNILDLTDRNEHIGNSHLSFCMEYRWKYLPEWLLCGHVHQNSGVAKYKNMTVINSACTQHTIEV